MSEVAPPREGESIWDWVERNRYAGAYAINHHEVIQRFFPGVELRPSVETYASEPDMNDWLYQNLDEDDFMRWGPRFYFTNESDAVMFRLRWSEYLVTVD